MPAMSLFLLRPHSLADGSGSLGTARSLTGVEVSGRECCSQSLLGSWRREIDGSDVICS